ncbi:MAG: hypothetical protein KGY45_01140 [Hadesarchaea archaeon]|nr:hypothetical protein [Hadesarchaea archaeon]
MSNASAFAPGHISGFFQVCDEHEDFARIGSRNCGPSISSGVLTEVETIEDESGIDIYVDEEKVEVKTTQTAVKSALKIGGVEARVKVSHSLQAPIGAGYGLSGAGAIGAVMALSEAMDLRFSFNQISEIAHKAEVACKTGLGDVGPQMIGGLVISKEPGSAPYGEWIKIRVPEDLHAVCGTWGTISTFDFLNKPKLKDRSRELGEDALKDLMKNQTPEDFMRVSLEFAKNMGVLNNEVIKVLENLSSETPMGASAVMLGKAVFALAKKSEIEDVKSEFLNYFDSESIIVTPIDFQGARVLD